MFWRIFGKPDLTLTDEEIELRRIRQRRLMFLGGALVLLFLVGILLARPALNLVRGWQARRHAQKAFAFIEHEQWTEARNEAMAGYQLRPTEPQAIRALAQLFSRAGQPDGLRFWKELRESSTLTRADLRDEAGLALRAREFEIADRALKDLLGPREGGPTPTDWLLAADLAMQEQDLDRATTHVRQLFGSSAASERQLFQATLLLDRILRGKEMSNRSEVLQRLATLAHGQSAVSLDALITLAQQILSTKDAPSAPGMMSSDDIIGALESHPLAKTQHKLLAVDLKIHEHPAEIDRLVEAATSQWKSGDDATLIALAAWLNSHGEYQRELDTIPRQRAMQTRELFSQHVDALGALGRWDEIRRLIESEQFPLDPVVEHMYLARCFAQQNQTSGAENNWQRALEAAAGDGGKLMVLAEYAEKNGAMDVAGAAFEAAVTVAPKSRIAQQGRLRAAYAARDTTRIHNILIDLSKIWPNDPAIQNDEAYTRLLLLPSEASTPTPPQADQSSTSAELIAIEHQAEKLVAREPLSLPHRTLLALTRLKQNRPSGALEVYKDINVPATALTTSAIAVHAAVLAANGHQEEAKSEFSHVPIDKILPEEKELGPK